MSHAGLACHCETPELRPADRAAVRTQRQRLDDVGAPPDAAVKQDRGAARHRIGDARQRVERARHTVELAPAVVGDKHPVHAVRHRFGGVGGVEDALEQERPFPHGTQRSDVVPLHALIRQRQHSLVEGGEVVGVSGPAVVAEGDLRNGAPHAKQPAQLERHVGDLAGREAGRDDEAVADVALAVAENLRVDCDDQGLVACRRRALRHLVGEPAVSVNVGLEPARLDAGLGQLFECADRAVAEAIDGAGLGCRACRSGLALRPKQAGEPRGWDDERHGQSSAEERGREIAARRSADGARIERHRVERGYVPAERVFVAGTAIDEVEHRARQHAPSFLPERRDVVSPPLPAGLAFARHPHPRRYGAPV